MRFLGILFTNSGQAKRSTQQNGCANENGQQKKSSSGIEIQALLYTQTPTI